MFDQRYLLVNISDTIREYCDGIVEQKTSFCCKGNNKHAGVQILQMLSSFPKPSPKCPVCSSCNQRCSQSEFCCAQAFCVQYGSPCLAGDIDCNARDAQPLVVDKPDKSQDGSAQSRDRLPGQGSVYTWVCFPASLQVRKPSPTINQGHLTKVIELVMHARNGSKNRFQISHSKKLEGKEKKICEGHMCKFVSCSCHFKIHVHIKHMLYTLNIFNFN